MKRIAVVIFGLGGVGQALVRQIIEGRAIAGARNQVRFDVVALVDSQRWLWEPAGLSDERLGEAVAAKQKRQPLEEARPPDLEVLERVSAAGFDNVIVVDVTAAAGMEPVIDQALVLGCGVVLANKKPLAGPWSTAQKFFNNRQLRHESTVGGGQPVIATLRYLLDTHDPIYRIEGQLSGTLGFICSLLDEEVPFSEALAEAKARGYTEPDPREDLGGRDVMRKIMILGRMAGWPLEESDIQIESLYPSALAHLSVTEFMAASVTIDASMGERVQAAATRGNVLRYVAELEGGKGAVGLKALPRHSPLANLKYISFRTGRYEDGPLLIGGKGAGLEMTAAGVLGDMISLSREQKSQKS